VLVVEDAVNGVKAAKAAGAFAIAVTTSLPAEKFQDLADLVMDGLHDVFDLLQKQIDSCAR
jgi:beta-phosphoglucomutase-like phosphatase (HAD superfamily)